jgi:hypothetical protein
MADEVKEGVVATAKPEKLLMDEHSGVHPLAVPDDVHAFLMSQGTGGELQEGDPFRRIIEQVLSAETPDAVLTPIEAVSANDMIAIPLLLHDFALNKSDYDAGSPFFASMECTKAQDDTPVVVNTGHKRVLAQLVKLKQFNQFPYQIQITQTGINDRGTPMLALRSWTEQVSPPPF